MIDERSKRYAYLAGDLRPKVQRVARFAPRSEWQIRPQRFFTHSLNSSGLSSSAHSDWLSDIVAYWMDVRKCSGEQRERFARARGSIAFPRR